MQRLLLCVAEPILPVRPVLDPAERNRVGLDLAEFLTLQTSALPRHLWLLFRTGLFAFQWLPVLRYGRPYTALKPEQRRLLVANWSTSRLSPKRDLLKLIRSCTLFYYLDHPLVSARLEQESANAEAPGGGSLG
jgi:hypothetical protein